MTLDLYRVAQMVRETASFQSTCTDMGYGECSNGPASFHSGVCDVGDELDDSNSSWLGSHKPGAKRVADEGAHIYVLVTNEKEPQLLKRASKAVRSYATGRSKGMMRSPHC